MKKFIFLLCLPTVLFACSSSGEKNGEDAFVPPEKKEIVKYYPDGKLRTEGMLYDGERHGKWTYYYDNGMLWSEGMFKYGVRDGYSLLFYKNGRKMASGQYEDNKAVGDWYFYSEDGELLKTVNAKEDPAALEAELRRNAQNFGS